MPTNSTEPLTSLNYSSRRGGDLDLIRRKRNERAFDANGQVELMRTTATRADLRARVSTLVQVTGMVIRTNDPALRRVKGNDGVATNKAIPFTTQKQWRAVVQIVTIARFRRPLNPRRCNIHRYHVWRWQTLTNDPNEQPHAIR
jgi:hypothetical protein